MMMIRTQFLIKIENTKEIIQSVVDEIDQTKITTYSIFRIISPIHKSMRVHCPFVSFIRAKQA